jgi:hypothetical protein
MYTNSIAVWLAPEDDADSPYAFSVSLSRGTKSRWLNMGVVDEVDKTAKTISWKYLKPSKFSGPAKNKYLTSKVAENTKAWILSAEAVTSPWNDDEMLIAWDRDENDGLGWSIKDEQYKQLVLVLGAIELVGEDDDVEEEEDDDDIEVEDQVEEQVMEEVEEVEMNVVQVEEVEQEAEIRAGVEVEVDVEKMMEVDARAAVVAGGGGGGSGGAVEVVQVEKEVDDHELLMVYKDLIATNYTRREALLGLGLSKAMRLNKMGKAYVLDVMKELEAK